MKKRFLHSLLLLVALGCSQVAAMERELQKTMEIVEDEEKNKYEVWYNQDPSKKDIEYLGLKQYKVGKKFLWLRKKVEPVQTLPVFSSETGSVTRRVKDEKVSNRTVARAKLVLNALWCSQNEPSKRCCFSLKKFLEKFVDDTIVNLIPKLGSEFTKKYFTETYSDLLGSDMNQLTKKEKRQRRKVKKRIKKLGSAVEYGLKLMVDEQCSDSDVDSEDEEKQEKLVGAKALIEQLGLDKNDRFFDPAELMGVVEEQAVVLGKICSIDAPKNLLSKALVDYKFLKENDYGRGYYGGYGRGRNSYYDESSDDESYGEYKRNHHSGFDYNGRYARKRKTTASFGGFGGRREHRNYTKNLVRYPLDLTEKVRKVLEIKFDKRTCKKLYDRWNLGVKKYGGKDSFEDFLVNIITASGKNKSEVKKQVEIMTYEDRKKPVYTSYYDEA
jgi:hypothetical protein